MLREDIENVDYNSLTDLEKHKYALQLTYNARRLCLQLMNAGHAQLAGIISAATSLSQHPAKLEDLLDYSAKLFQIAQIDQAIMQRSQALAQAQEVEAKPEAPIDNFPPLDSDKEQ